MPTYDYKCSNCGAIFEHFQSMTERPIQKCQNCGKNSAVRLIGGGSGLIFKGSGFYITDYKNKNTSESKPAKKDSKEPKKESAAKETANSTASKSTSTESVSDKNS